MRVLMASAEVNPFAKVGGMADVAGSLPKALHELGVDIRVIMPKYLRVGKAGQPLQRRVDNVIVPVNDSFVSGCALDESTLPGSEVPVYFVEHHGYFSHEEVYGRPDELERLAFFCRATLAACEGLQWTPDVIHLNDWHTGLIPAYICQAQSGPATLFTIHNLGYQGQFPGLFDLVGIRRDTPAYWASACCGNLVFAKAGLVCSDLLNAVSEGYAREIMAPEFGAGRDAILRDRRDDLFGIVNGIDYSEWDRAKMPPKREAKAALQKEMGLPVRPEAPLLGIVSRIASQKGFDLVAAAADRIFRHDAQFVLLGTGEPHLEEAFRQLHTKLPSKVSLRLGFDADLARRIYAGSDMFLMPSRYEPCGLGQMIALAYGTIPVVRATGGLADTVHETGDMPNGFVFEPYEADELAATVERALAAHADQARWQQLVQNAYACDFSWTASAKRYVELYERALRNRTERPRWCC